jgi:hypothetical protein
MIPLKKPLAGRTMPLSSLENNDQILPAAKGFFGAGDEIRTRDIHLGRVTLYQLSYSRRSLQQEVLSRFETR